MYKVKIHRKAEREIRSLPQDIRSKVIELLIKLSTTPYPFRDHDLKKIRASKMSIA